MLFLRLWDNLLCNIYNLLCCWCSPDQNQKSGLYFLPGSGTDYRPFHCPPVPPHVSFLPSCVFGRTWEACKSQCGASVPPSRGADGLHRWALHFHSIATERSRSELYVISDHIKSYVIVALKTTPLLVLALFDVSDMALSILPHGLGSILWWSWRLACLPALW